MLRNYFRQSFFFVFFPLALAAGIFWMGELRGYRAEMTLLILPKTETAKGAAGNLAALAKQPSFAVSVYALDDRLDTPFTGETPSDRKAIWQAMTSIESVTGSDLVLITARAADQEEALLLSRAIAEEIVRTASGLYNQKTDIDIRIVEEAVVTSSLSAWPRFAFYTVGTAFAFTVIFFLVHSLIDTLFPRRRPASENLNEYVISPETFKPQVPTYWAREENGFPTETVIEEAPVVAEAVEPDEPMMITSAEEAYAEIERASAAQEETTEEVSSSKEVSASPFVETEETNEEIPEAYVEPTVPEALPEAVEEIPPAEEYFEPATDIPDNELSDSADFSRAAAPDNLPIIETDAITPLQGAQARLMKEDIDETAAFLESEPAELPVMPEETNSAPQIHEPSPEDYKHRLNELLSGKM